MFVWPEYIKIEQSFCAFIFLFFQIKNTNLFRNPFFNSWNKRKLSKHNKLRSCGFCLYIKVFSCHHQSSFWGWTLNVYNINLSLFMTHSRLLFHRARGTDSPRHGARARKKESEGGGWAAGARQASSRGGQGGAGQTGCRPAEDSRATGVCCLTDAGSSARLSYVYMLYAPALTRLWCLSDCFGLFEVIDCSVWVTAGTAFIAGFWTGWIHSKDLSPRRRQEEERGWGHRVAAQGNADFIDDFMHQMR